MNKEDQLDTELMGKYANQLILDFTEVITSKPKSKEMSGAAVAALAQVLAIVTTKLVGADKAAEVISIAVNRGIEATADIRKEIGLI